MARQIDTKYMTTGEIFKLDGTPIPTDEPLLLFRGRDAILPELLDHYVQLRLERKGSASQMKLLREQVAIIKKWQLKHPTRVQVPK